MIIKNKKLIFFSGLLVVLVLALVVNFTNKEIKAETTSLGGLACFVNADCTSLSSYNDGCTFGYGPATCSSVNYQMECDNCASSYSPLQFPNLDRRCNDYNICQFSFSGSPPWINCGQCYDTPMPSPNPSCNVDPEDFNYALYIKAPNGNIQFALTDSGHLLTLDGDANVYFNQGDNIVSWFEALPDNNLPVYNGDTLVAFFHSDNDGSGDMVVLRGGISEFQVPLEPPGEGNFIIKNSADTVVAYIDPNGNLYLMGCVNDVGYEF